MAWRPVSSGLKRNLLNFDDCGWNTAIIRSLSVIITKPLSMNRKQFIKTTALAVAGIAAGGSFLESCKKSTKGPQGPDVNFTIDLNDSKYANLAASGGFVYVGGVIIARINDFEDGYLAVAQTCTHESCTITYSRGSQTFPCPCHGGTFDLNGNVIAGPPPYPIKRYSVSKNGSKLTVSG